MLAILPAAALLIAPSSAQAGVPITLYRSFAANRDLSYTDSAAGATQLAWQLPNKLVIDTIQNEQYMTFGTFAGVEIRKGFRPGWDMSMHGRLRHQTRGDEISASYGLSVGRILVDNVWLSLGDNLTGFYDPEFSASEYMVQGPYFRIRAKFDPLGVTEALKVFR